MLSEVLKFKLFQKYKMKMVEDQDEFSLIIHSSGHVPFDHNNGKFVLPNWNTEIEVSQQIMSELLLLNLRLGSHWTRFLKR